MDASRWHEISPLLDEALGFDTDRERDEWLARLRDEHADLADKVQSLLATHQAAASEHFLDDDVLPPRPGRLTAGALLGPYAITRRIGAGGMGEVYQARDTRLGRTVAIKVLGPELDLTGDRRRRFLREAQAVSALSHPNIVTLYDIGQDRGVDFLVLEYVEGSTLDVVVGRGALPIAEAIGFARQIAEGMAKAHAAGVLHRDLKPSNVILANDCTVKVLDFGLAKASGAPPSEDERAWPGSPSLTREGAVSGTPAYMSPEQAEGRPVDARSDIFSFGALLYEMVTGTRAFHGGSATGAITAVRHQDPKPLSELVPDVPAALEALIERCLQKDAAQRVQSMADVCATLQQIDAARTRSVPSRWRSWPWWSVAALAVVGVAAWSLFKSGETGSASLAAIPLTSHPGNEYSPTLSPDGSQVAYVADHAGGNMDVYVQPTRPGATPVQLTNTPERESWPAWSPDGRWIAFRRSFSDGRAQIVRRSIADGAEAIVLQEACPGLAWASDSRSIVCAGLAAGPRGLRQFPSEGGPAVALTDPAPGQFDMFPAVSPDGRTIAFARASEASPARDLYELVLGRDGRVQGAQTLRHKFAGLVNSMHYVAANDLLVSAVPETATLSGDLRLTRLAMRRQPIEPLMLDLPDGSLSRPVVAGGRLVYEQLTSRHEIWSTRDGVEQQHPVTSTRDDEGARFSPDGTRIAFISARSGPPEIWLARADGSDANQLTTIGGVDWVNWAPDGTWLVYSRREKTALAAICSIAVSGGEPRRLTSGATTDLRPSVSRDGRRVYFSSDKTGRREVYRMSPDGRDVVAVTTDGGDFPEETFDGQTLVFVRTSGTASGTGPLFSINVTGGPARQLPVKSLGLGGFVIGRDGVYVRTSLPDRSISVYDPATNVTRSIAALTASNELSSISADGRVLLWNHSVFAGRDLMIVNNFR